jgi:hypothetical protein
MIFRNMDPPHAWDDELRAALRLDPGFTLDPNNYAPALRARLERLRRDMAHEPRERLQIGSKPSGAKVFLDGREMGQTPFDERVLLGPYALTLQLNGRTTFPRRIVLDQEQPLSIQVDASFETAFDTRGFTCLVETPPPEPQAGNALKLGTVLEAEQVVLVRVARPAVDTLWLTASVFNVQSAQRLREAGIKLSRDAHQRGDAVHELAQFVSTGRYGPGVEPVLQPASLPPDAVPVATAAQARTWKTPVGIGAASLGGAAAVVGVVLAFQSAATWRRFDAYYPSETQSPPPDQLPTVAAIKNQAQTERTWAIVSLCSAAAFGATGVALLILDAHAPRNTPRAVQPVVGLGSVGLTGPLP